MDIESLYRSLLAALAGAAREKANLGDPAYAARLERFARYVEGHRESYRKTGTAVSLGIALDMQDLSSEMYDDTEVSRLCSEVDAAIRGA